MVAPINYVLAASVEIIKKHDYCVIIDRRKLNCNVIHPSEALILSLLNARITRNELTGIFSGIYEVPSDVALKAINAVLEKLKEYLSLNGNPEMAYCRYEPDMFIYPGFSEFPGLIAPNDIPLNLTLILTNRCNFRCIYCYADLSVPSLSISGSDAVRLINDAAAMGAVNVSLSGGEPLLHPEIGKIISTATERGMLVVLVTNASLLDEQMADKLFNAGLEGIQVSLDAPSASLHHYLTGSENTFDRVVAGIRILKARGFWIGIRSVVMSHNWKAMPELVDLLSGLGVDEIAMSTQATGACNRKDDANIERLGKMELEYLQDMISEKSIRYPGCKLLFSDRESPWQVRKDIVPCGNPMGGFVVHPSGEVTICEMLKDDPEISMGNVHASSIEEIWLGQRHRHFLEQISDISRIDPACAKCESLSHCRTGCFNLSKTVYDDYYRKDPRCPGPETLKYT